jgi:fatty acid desaturase
MNNALSYSEHYNATDPEDTKKDSTSCYNKIYNFLFFNTGYHQEHHYRPGVHWTKLPELQHQLPEDRNIVKYCLYNNNPYHD